MRRFADSQEQKKAFEESVLATKQMTTERRPSISEHDYDENVDVVAIARRTNRITSVAESVQMLEKVQFDSKQRRGYLLHHCKKTINGYKGKLTAR